MMTFGPFAMVPGTPQNVPIPADTVSLRVTNRSPFDLFLAVNQGTPPVQTQAGIGYFEVVGSGDRVTVALPQSVLQQSFGSVAQGTANVAGQLWLIPNQADTLAQAGVASRRNAVYVTAFEIGDEASSIAGVPELVDLSSEQKLMRLPLGASFCASGQGSFGATGTTIGFTPNDAGLHNYFFPVGSSSLFLGVLYIHYLSVMIRGDNSGDVSFKLQLLIKNGLGVTQSTLDTIFGTAINNLTNFSGTAFEFAPRDPWVLSFQQGSGISMPFQVAMQFISTAGTPSMTVLFNLVASFDLMSGLALPDIGTPATAAIPPATGGTGIF